VDGLLAGLLLADVVFAAAVFLVLDRVDRLRLRPRRVTLGAAAALGLVNLLVPMLVAAIADRTPGVSDATWLGVLTGALLTAHAATLFGARRLASASTRPRASSMLLLALGSVVAAIALFAVAVWMTFPSFDHIALPSSFH
jgi:hypothetical protein